MPIHIALVAHESERSGVECNSWIYLVGNLEDPAYLQQLNDASEFLEDGAIVYGDMSVDLSQDAADALVALEAMIALDPFREALEHLLNIGHRLGTRRSRKEYSEVAIKARLQAEKAAAALFVSGDK